MITCSKIDFYLQQDEDGDGSLRAASSAAHTFMGLLGRQRVYSCNHRDHNAGLAAWVARHQFVPFVFTPARFQMKGTN